MEFTSVAQSLIFFLPCVSFLSSSWSLSSSILLGLISLFPAVVFHFLIALGVLDHRFPPSGSSPQHFHLSCSLEAFLLFQLCFAPQLHLFSSLYSPLKSEGFHQYLPYILSAYPLCPLQHGLLYLLLSFIHSSLPGYWSIRRAAQMYVMGNGECSTSLSSLCIQIFRILTCSAC